MNNHWEGGRLEGDDMSIFMFIVLPDFSRKGFLEPYFSAVLILGNLNCQASIQNHCHCNIIIEEERRKK